MSPAVARVLEALRACACDPKEDGNGWTFRCPAHHDHHPSAHLGEGRDGKALLYCFGGCTYKAIADQVGIVESDLFDKESGPRAGATKQKTAPKRKHVDTIPSTYKGAPEVARYSYTLDNGTGDAIKIRYQIEGAEGKEFLVYEVDSTGGFWRGLGGRKLDLYAPGPALTIDQRALYTAILSEGEKATDACAKYISGLGDSAEFYVAVGTHGSGSFHGEDGARLVRGLEGFAAVAGVVDRDEDGDRWAEEFRRHAEARLSNIRFVQSAVTTAKADLADHLAAGYSLEQLVPLAEPEDAPGEQPEPWARSMFENINDPNAGEVEDLIEGLIPKGEVTIIGATWKTAKTLLVYHLALAALSARRVFGRFAIPDTLKVCVFQLEMPEREDLRRFRRLALGLGMLPEEVTAFAKSGQLVHYNRPDLSLCTPEGVKDFQNAVIASGAPLVIVDSLLAAFAGADINDNSVVRKLFTSAFKKLTTLGITIILLHHKRKASSGSRPGQDDDRSSLLAAQAWGAAAGRVFSLDRLPQKGDKADANGEPMNSTAFCVRLAVSGSWTPNEASEVVLEIADKGEATTITALDDVGQAAAKTLTKTQRAALALAKLVRERVSIDRDVAVALVSGQTGISRRTVESGLSYAKAMGWIESRPTPGAKHNEQTLVPGDSRAVAEWITSNGGVDA